MTVTKAAVSASSVPDALALARSALDLYESEPARAEHLARRALHAVDHVDDPVARSIAMRALGMVAWERQAIGDAVNALRIAVTVADDGNEPVLAGEGRAKLALVLSYAGHDDAALAEADAAAAVLTGRPLAELHHHVAAIIKRQGRLHEALALETRALRSFRRHRDSLWTARALNNRAINLAELGQLAAAQRDLIRAEELYGELGMTLGRLKARNNRAWLASLLGDVPGALDLHAGLQRELETIGVPPGLFRLDHAAVLMGASLHSEALAVAERAAAELADDGMAADGAEALLLASAAARLAGAYDVAERLGTEAVATFDAQNRPAWALRAQHAVIEAVWRAGRDDAKTDALARRIATELDDAGWKEWAGEVHLLVGRMALARHDVETATEHLASATARLGRRLDHLAGIAALEAGLHAANHDPVRARRALRRGLRRCEQHEATIGSTELRVIAARHAAELAGLGLGWAVASGRAAAVLAWAERRRAATLRLPPIQPPRDRQLARMLAERRAASYALEQQAVRDPCAGADPATLKRGAMLDSRIRERLRAKQGHGVAVDGTTFNVRALGAALGDRALLELVAVDGDLVALSVNHGRCSMDRLGSMREVQTELDFLRMALGRMAMSTRSNAIDALTASLQRVDELVLQPVLDRLGDGDLVVVPVATLHSVPWGALPSVRDRAVTIAPSATTWMAAAGVQVPTQAPVVVVAGPGLEHADAEADAVTRTAGAAQTLTGNDATASNVTRALNGARIAHLACHGRFRSDNPLFSSLRLADGPLTVYELERLRRAPHLVVLSACDSAIGSVSAGDELMGLTASLLALGSSTLVGSIAPVRDEWTQPLMLAFHERLAAGAPPANALAAARRETSVAGPGAYATAVAFGCFGAGAPIASTPVRPRPVPSHEHSLHERRSATGQTATRRRNQNRGPDARSNLR